MAFLEAVLTPIILLAAAGVGGLVSWSVKSLAEELRAVEERLREDRRTIYADEIDPFVRLLTSPSDPIHAAAVQETLMSVEYRRTVFNLMLYGGDEAIEAYNGFLHYLWTLDANGKTPDAGETMRRLGIILLAIRRNLGNKNSNLDEWDMLRGFIRDVDKYAQEFKRPE